MQTALLVLHILLAAGLIALILLQQGKGADTGAAFGSGASNTVFGARGAASFLSRTTAILAIAFFTNALVLSHLASRKSVDASLMDRVQETAVIDEVPAVDGVPAVPAVDSDVPVIPEQ